MRRVFSGKLVVVLIFEFITDLEEVEESSITDGSSLEKNNLSKEESSKKDKPLTIGSRIGVPI